MLSDRDRAMLDFEAGFGASETAGPSADVRPNPATWQVEGC